MPDLVNLNQRFYAGKRISHLYTIVFLLNDNEEIKLFGKQIEDFERYLNSRSNPKSTSNSMFNPKLHYIYDFTGISTKNIFYKIYDLANVYYDNFEVINNKTYETYLKDEFNENFKKIKSWCENNPNKELNLDDLINVLMDFEKFKHIFKGSNHTNFKTNKIFCGNDK